MGHESSILDPYAAESIRTLKARYFRFVDLKAWTKLRTLFTDDARFEGFWSSAPGPDAFVANIESNLGGEVVSVHQGFTPEFMQVAPERIRGVWAMSDYLTWPPNERSYLGVSLEGQRGVRGYGHYEDEYVRTAKGWRISFMRLTRIRIDPIVELEEQAVFPFAEADVDWLP